MEDYFKDLKSNLNIKEKELDPIIRDELSKSQSDFNESNSEISFTSEAREITMKSKPVKPKNQNIFKPPIAQQ